jgi:hypothetical protein
MKLGRCWQGKGHYLLWEVTADKKKKYLKVDCTQAHFGVSLVAGKPLDLLAQGGIATLIRKVLPSCTVLDIVHEKSSGNIYLLLSRGSVLILHASKPPVLELIDSEKRSYFRYGQKGSFTKSKTYNEELPGEGLVSILPSLLAAAKNHEQLAEITPPRETTPQVSSFQSAVRKLIARKAKTVAAALQKEEKTLVSAARIAELENQALLLQQYIYLLQPQQAELKINPEQSGQASSITIPLDPTKDRRENLAAAFAAAKKAKKQRALGVPRLASIANNCAELNAALVHLREQELSDDEISNYLTKFRISTAPSSPTTKSPSTSQTQQHRPYRSFVLADKSIILVGKTAADNDLLTKQAKANDFWLHALGTEGSHVLIPRKNLPAGQLSPASKTQAAILALHFSHLRGNFAGEVYFTTRQHLKKKPGLPPGKWLVAKAETVYVRYDEARLQQVLSSASKDP